MAGEIPPPQTIPNQFLQQQQLQNHNALIQDSQQSISKLPIGAQIIAQVTGADKNGNLTVRVAGSDLLLSSPIALAKGAALTLRVVGTSDNVAFQLISVDGKLPPTQAQTVTNQLQQNPQALFLKPVVYNELAKTQIPTGQANPQAQPTLTATTAAITQQAVVVSDLSTTLVQGIVLKPSPEALKVLRDSISINPNSNNAEELISKLPASLNSGSKIDFKITDIQQPQFPSAPAQNPATASTQDKVQTGNQVLKGQDFQRQANEQLLRDTAANNFQPKVSVTENGTLKITAQVVATSGGQAVVDTALGRVVIANQFDANRVQIGTILSLNIQQFTPEEIALQDATIKDLFTEWPALKALQSAFTQAGASQNMNKLSGLDSLFILRLAGFFKAVKENNIDNWLSSELIRNLDPNILDAIKAKMTGDFANLTRLYHDNANTGWQTVLFPVYDGKDLHQARFFVKDLQDENAQSSGKRFVVELTTGAFGEVQLDGLVRKNAAQNRFDLMVRTSNYLPEDVRTGIAEIFNNAAEITGIKGSVDFATLDNALRPAGLVLEKQMQHQGWQA